MLANLRQSANRIAALTSQLSRSMATKSVSQEIATIIKDETLPSTKMPGQAFVGDLRSTSALSVGDGITTHTGKWLQGNQKSPIEYIQGTEPIEVHGLVVASYGSEDPGLGCPVEYINLKGTTRESPAVCKYTGNKYYSNAWLEGGGH